MVAANFPWLSVLVAVPAAGAALLGFVPPLRRAAGRVLALVIALVELALGVYVAASVFDWSAPASYQVYESHLWIPQIGITWSLSVTALGLVMILLALGLVPLVLIAGWDEDEAADRGAYPALVLALEAFMVVIFAAYDLTVFYFAFEAMLVPLYLMIGRYGVGDEAARHKAAMKFLLYSLFGGLVMLGGILYLWAMGSQAAQDVSTFFRIDTLAQILPSAPLVIQMIIFVTFMVAFAIKAPMVPVHTWLPDTAAVARPGTSVLLVGVLDKIGTFGMITLCLQLTPGAAVSAKWVMCILAVISILWGGLAANGQNDIMRLVSYTSVSHFGFMVLGIFIGTQIALVGAMFYMVAHGVSIAAMFLLSGLALAPRRHAGHARVRGHAARDPGARGPVAPERPRLHRAARPVRLRPRVPRAHGHLVGEQRAGALRGPRRRHRRHVRAHALPARLHRRARQGQGGPGGPGCS